MRVWLIQTGEILPLKKVNRRMRTSLLAYELIKKGHDILWWASSFNHLKKKWIYKKDHEIRLNSMFRIKLLKGIGYKNNFSLRRFIDHRIIAWKFRKKSFQYSLPDIIIASTPPYDIAYQAVKFAKKNNIPIIVDIRDMWPDIFLDYFPKKFKRLFTCLLYKEFKMLEYTLKHSTCMVSMMESMLKWGLKKAKRKKTIWDRVFYLGARKLKPLRSNVPYRFKSLYTNIKNKFIVLFIGTFGEYCNPLILSHAAKKLEDYNIHFILGGDGIYFKKVKEASKSLKNLTLTGWLVEEEIRFFLSISHVGIIPCNNPTGAFPNKVFTYLSGGLPIISSAKGELKKLIYKHQIGFYYPSDDIDTLVKHIKKMYENNYQYKTMRDNSKKLFAERFDADKIYQQYAEHIEEVAKNFNKIKEECKTHNKR